jgi:hypothetical protein
LDDVLDNLPFARAQRGKHRFNALPFAPRLAGFVVPVFGQFDGAQKFFALDRLHKEVDSPRLHGLHACGHVGIAGKEDDRPFRAGLRDLLLKLETVELWHDQVENGAARSGWIVLPQKIKGR